MKTTKIWRNRTPKHPLLWEIAKTLSVASICSGGAAIIHYYESIFVIAFTILACSDIIERVSYWFRMERITESQISPANVKVMAHPLARANVDRGVEVEIR